MDITTYMAALAAKKQAFSSVFCSGSVPHTPYYLVSNIQKKAIYIHFTYLSSNYFEKCFPLATWENKEFSICVECDLLHHS